MVRPEPAERLVVLTCMDARYDPLEALGLQVGDAHVVRNAGGRASDDAIRSIAVSQALLGTRRVIVIHHTDCGVGSNTQDEIRTKLGDAAAEVDFLTFTDLEESVRDDVLAIRGSALVPHGGDVTGAIYDVTTGRLREVTT